MSAYGNNCVSRKWFPTNVDKYVGDPTGIVARSSWEIKFMNFLDMNPGVVRWASEEIPIPYFDPVKNKQRRYFIDFWAEIKDAQGNIKRYLIEIKPDKFTRPPEQPKRKTKRYLEEVMQWSTNNAKWSAAQELCKRSGTEFMILTERHIFNAK
jgi:hypothetical protein